MERIKICYVVTNIKRTGPINQTLNIIRYMDKNIFEPLVITLFAEEKDNTIIEEYRQLNIPIFQLNLTKIQCVFSGKSVVKKVLDEVKPDIIQGVGFPPLRTTLPYKSSKHMITLRNYCYEDYPDKYGKIVGKVMAYMDVRLIRKLLSKGEPVVTCSQSLSDMYKNEINLDFEYIRNGVELNKFKRRNSSEVRDLRIFLNLPTDKMVFLYSGNMIDRKNQREAIEGFLLAKSNEKSVLVLLGDGDNLKCLKETYKQHSNVIFCGKVDNVSDFLRASDVYLSSSKSEGLPNGVLEAMATGIPVILSDIIQHEEIFSVSDKIGYLYKLSDIKNLAEQIDKITASNIESLGDNSYNVVSHHFSAEIMSMKYQDYYKKVLNQ